MENDDRIAKALETGDDASLSAHERDRVSGLRDALGSPSLWDDPPEELGAAILSEIGVRTTRRGSWWAWAAAAAVALVLGTIGVMSLLEESPPPPVATITLVGTSLTPEASGTAELFSTPNGWAIALDASGLDPAEEGTFYQGWVNNGTDAVAVGTFHMRGDEPTPIALWSGVDLREYTTLNVTIQNEGGGPESSAVVVLTGTADVFDG